MRTRVVVSAACCLALAWAGAVRAEDAAGPRAIIDKALKAQGGEAELAKYKGQTFKEKGTYYGMGNAQPYTATYAVQYPNQFKMEVQGVFGMVLNGDKGWMTTNGNTEEMTKEQLAVQQEGMYTRHVTTLVPLKDKGFQLAPLGESKVGDHAVVGVKVSHKGHNDINLYFDKDSGLLRKSEGRAKDMMTLKEVDEEITYSDHKDVQGAKVPMKIDMKRDGKQYVEAEMEDVKLVEKLEADVFAKP